METEDELLDIWIDTQGATQGAYPAEFAREPWKCFSDARGAYFGLRYAKRNEFLERISFRHRRIVELEIKNVQLQRTRLSSNKHKRDLILEMQNARYTWQNEVVSNIPGSRRLVRERMTARLMTESECVRDLRLLSRLEVSLQPRVAETLNQNSNSTMGSKAYEKVLGMRRKSALKSFDESNGNSKATLDELHGFKASVMYFKKHASLWKGNTRKDEIHSGVFPNQKVPLHEILFNKTENPLSEVCAPDEMRWFHFPGNEVRWIEVLQLKFLLETLLQLRLS